MREHPMWMVAWISLMTGATGHGMCVDDKALAEAWAAYGNTTYAEEYRHWVEPCGEDL
jgi:hypothetical protein